MSGFDVAEVNRIFDEYEKQERLCVTDRVVTVERGLTGVDIFWVAVLVLGLPLFICLAGGHIG